MATPNDRTLQWDGLVNGRDLHGLATADGSRVAAGRLLRSASPHTLTAKGWQELVDYGVRTVIDLRHDWEITEWPVSAEHRRSEITRLSVPMEPPGYIEVWSERDDRWKLGTPLYYDEFVTEHPQRVASVIEAIASAPAGGVLVHCGSGRDRAGLAVAVALDLIGVDHDLIIADHWLSFDRDEPVEVTMGRQPQVPAPPLTREHHRQVLHAFLASGRAQGCFDDPASVNRLRGSLLGRLCTTG